MEIVFATSQSLLRSLKDKNYVEYGYWNSTQNKNKFIISQLNHRNIV